jgi:chromosome segregation ATPase
VEKEVLKCLDLMKEVEVEIGRKKAASARVKGLRGAIAAAGAEAAELEAQQQHLKRQMATLSDRIKRLESQVGGAAVEQLQQHVIWNSTERNCNWPQSA